MAPSGRVALSPKAKLPEGLKQIKSTVGADETVCRAIALTSQHCRGKLLWPSRPHCCKIEVA